MGDSSLADKVGVFSGVRVLVIGDAMIDHYVVGRVERISPEAPVPVLEVEREFDRVGGAANAAANASALGGCSKLLCLVGRGNNGRRDPDADRLAEKCSELDIETCFLRSLPVTIRKARMLARGQQMLRVDWDHHYGRSDDEQDAARRSGSPWGPLPLSGEFSRERSRLLDGLLKACDVVLVSDYAKGMVDRELMEQLVASGKPVAVDPRPQNSHLYKGVTLITPNRKEATQMLGLDANAMPEAGELAARLSENLSANILLTLSEEGMLLYEVNGRQTRMPALAKEVFDPTGAGDTVIGATALGIGAGLSLAEAAELANVAAGIVVGHIGTATVSPDELREALTKVSP